MAFKTSTKFYKLINLKRQGQGPFVLSQSGWDNLQATKEVKNVKLLGVCDAAGNLLEEVAQNNFISKTPVEKLKEIATKKPVIDDDDEDMPADPDFMKDARSNGPSLQTFADINKPAINDGNESTNSGARKAESEKAIISKKPAAKGSGKSGAGKKA